MSRVDLPDGAWAELASPRKVQERKRRRYLAAVADLAASASESATVTGSQLALADIVGDQLILCLVKEWSFGEVSDDILATLDTDQFDPLFKACRDLAPELVPDYSPDPDPKAPTASST